jgi:hypothetical protein
MDTEDHAAQPVVQTDVVETSVMDDEAAIEEAKRLKGRELDDALYAALLSRAHSDQARALVDTVVTMVAERELAAGIRTNKRDKKHTALRTAVERLLADLLQAQASETNKGYVFRSLRPEAFTGQAVSYRTFKSLVDVMLTLGFLEEYKGFQGWSDGFGVAVPWIRKATRYRATEALLSIFHQHSVKAADFHQHFLIPLPENPLRLRAASRRNQYGEKRQGRLMRFERTALTTKLEQELKDLNKFLDGFELRGGIHRGYTRVFNNGDHPKFDWNMGGRLYSYGEFNYQQLDRTQRLRMTINDEPVCEIDIRASYLTIFHALYDEPFDPINDPYDVAGLGPEARDVVKKWITASFGNNAPIIKWPKEHVAEYREKTGKTLGKCYPASKVGEKVMQAFPLLRRIGEVNDGRERGWAELMYIESQAMLSTMIGLMRSRRMPSWAVHDSLIVPVSSWHEATIALAHWYERFVNAWPVLVPHFPEGHEVPTFKQNQTTIGSGYITLSNEPEAKAYDPDDPLDARNF